MEESVSILIPCHNAEPWLATTLESALSQTWPSVEVIVVDDGSTDKSLKIARRFESRGLQVISQECRGASHARNRAFEASSGRFIQYLDSDDVLASDKIEQQMRLHQSVESECSLFSGSWGSFFDDPARAHFRPQPVWADFSAIDWLLTSWGGGGMMHPAAWLTERSVIEAAGPWNESLSLNDDGEFFTRVILKAGQVVFCESARSYYRQGHEGRLSALRTSRAIESAYLAAELSTKALLSIENNPRTREAVANVFQRFAYTIYPDDEKLVALAEAKVKEFGGSELQIEGGPRFQWLRRIFGWKLAKKFK